METHTQFSRYLLWVKHVGWAAATEISVITPPLSRKAIIVTAAVPERLKSITITAQPFTVPYHQTAGKQPTILCP